MNISKIKTYAIQARKDFIKAVTERANIYGIFSDDHIEEIEFRGDLAIIGERAFPKKEGELRKKLAGRIKRDGFSMVVRAFAYTWFNRFIALRYMEIHDYLEHGYRVLSNNGDLTIIPEILEHAADVQFQGLDKDRVIELKLAGTKDNELYRLLILAQCNDLHKSMPFLFDSIDNETALLLPDNLLHSDSPIRKMVTEIDESDWNDVEIIGWIYQFYISERKDEVIGKVVKSEDIPAATQLFTPNWIVKYMVQNTLGRMWLATNPDSRLKDKMEYYIEPAEQEPDVQKQIDEITPKELNPEEITFLDPACGSGHILVEAYDLFREIYLERGYRTKDIPGLIIEKNLYGLDIDDRAAQLACFAVLMKAREDDRRILGRDDLKLNIMAIQESDKSYLKNIEIFFKDDAAIKDGLTEIIKLFENAKTFGSLITVSENLAGKRELFETAIQKNIDEVFKDRNVERLKALLRQMEILEKQYDCVVTNPPYMGGKGMNPKLKAFAKDQFPAGKSDLFAMFIERALDLLVKQGFVGMITMQSWMFLSSYEKLRKSILNQKTILSMAHLGARAFDSIGGEVVSTTSFILANVHHPEYKGGYARLVDGNSEAEKKTELFHCVVQSKNTNQKPNFHLASAAYFKKIPGSPIAYWMSKGALEAFNAPPLYEIATFRAGLQTGDNDLFLRFWHEVARTKFIPNCRSRKDSVVSEGKWFPHNKGGGFRKWNGNKEYCINWENDGFDIKAKKITDLQNGKITPNNSKCWNQEFYFEDGLTWSSLSSSDFSLRSNGYGFLFDTKGQMLFIKDDQVKLKIFALLNSCVSKYYLSALSPTLDFNGGVVSKLPLVEVNINNLHYIRCLIDYSKNDWNFYETSWDFTSLPLLQLYNHRPTLKETYTILRTHWQEMTLEMQRLEEENNRIFIKAYGFQDELTPDIPLRVETMHASSLHLQDELTPDVPLSEITLTCNPHYRYNGNKTEEELETLLLTDTIKELISYAIGCMMGRYSLDHPGLIYAHSGNIDFDSSKYKTFPVDVDGIIPIMDMNWFSDDTTSRFVEFLKVAWPPETLDKNLRFIADTLKHRQNETPVDTIRRYLSAGFFKDHLKTYKKRPIYWLFSSGKQKAFECLVYLHRYNESTLSRMRSAYVTPLQGNFSVRLEFLRAERDVASTTSAKNKFQKEINKLKKKQSELSGFDEELRHYADMKISLDLDDGVKINYGKFGNLLAETKAVTGKK